MQRQSLYNVKLAVMFNVHFSEHFINLVQHSVYACLQKKDDKSHAWQMQGHVEVTANLKSQRLRLFPKCNVGVQALYQSKVVLGRESWKYLRKAQIIFIPAFILAQKQNVQGLICSWNFLFSQSLEKLGYSTKSQKFPAFLKKVQSNFAWAYS